jgi:hypothetical protein
MLDLTLLKDLAPIVSAFAVPVFAAGVGVLRGIRRDLQHISHELTGLGEWRTNHEKQDDERHTYLQHELDRLRDGNGRRPYGN